MSCSCNTGNRITIVRGNDTNFNGQEFVTLRLRTEIWDLSTMRATITLGGITKTFNDLSSEEINLSYTAAETATMPFGDIDGVLKMYNGDNQVATIESLLPFRVISIVHGNAIAVTPAEFNIEVKQGGETVLNIDIEAGVTVEVGTTTTLPAGSDATVTNSGTANHLVLDFGIPQGEKGDKGDTGSKGEDGKTGADGKDAKINGYNTLTVTATNGVQLNQSGDTANFSGKPLQDGISDINSKIPSAASSSNKLADVDFVNSSINNMAAFYVTSDVAGNPFATRAALVSGPWYFRGELREPTQNDYALVTEDETHDDETSRFMFDGDQWVWQYTLNNTRFTQAQLDAINSGATESLINQIGTNETNITTLQNTKQDNIDDLATIRSNARDGKSASETIANYGNIVTHNVNEFATAAQGAKADTAVQPAAIANMATTNTAQDITATKTFKEQQKIQSGSPAGCLIIGADLSATTLTNNTRKLGRMGFPTNEDITLNCAFVSCDTLGQSLSTIENSVEFGGRPGDQTSTSPDAINFTIAKEHNTTNNTKKQIALRIDKNAANFTVQPQYNGNDLVDVASAQTIAGNKTFTGNTELQGSAYNNTVVLKRIGTLGCYITFKNNQGVLGHLGLIEGTGIPRWLNSNNTENRIIVRAGGDSTVAVGDTLTPVYIDSNGIATVCDMSGYALNANAVTISNNDTVTLINNTCFRGETLSAFTISVPASYEYPFICEVDFVSGNTATTLTYAGSGTINWSKDSDDLESNVFVPAANTEYTLMFWFNGTSLCGIARAM